MKKLLITATALMMLVGCKPSQKETIKNIKSKVKKEDVCKLIEVTNEIIKTFYPDSKALFVGQTVEALGCKDIVKSKKELDKGIS
jgi:protein involved in sex pheromone biosynthesis